MEKQSDRKTFNLICAQGQGNGISATFRCINIRMLLQLKLLFRRCSWMVCFKAVR